MRAMCFLCYFLIPLSCAAPSKTPNLKSKSYVEFRDIRLGTATDLLAQWGQPLAKEPLDLDGVKFEVWRYGQQGNGARIEFLIDPTRQSAVEKIYFPTEQSKESKLQALLDGELKQEIFDRIPVRCRHSNELILISQTRDKFLVSRDEPDATVDAIAITSPQIAKLRMQQNARRKCR